ncbi:MAG: LamG domain-containing protein, partial [Chloroflexi bacterium]|nr:LamG domain-containing protein [Chloroflexota bacterium]
MRRFSRLCVCQLSLLLLFVFLLFMAAVMPATAQTEIPDQPLQLEQILASSATSSHGGTGFVYDANGQRIKTIQADGTAIYTPFPGYEEEVQSSILFQSDFESSGEIIENSYSAFPMTSIWRGTSSIGAPASGNSSYAISNLAYGIIESDFVTLTPKNPQTPDPTYKLTAFIRGEIDLDDSQQGWVIRARFYDDTNTQLGWQDAAADYNGGSISTTWTQKGEGSVIDPYSEHPTATKMTVALYNYFTSGWVAFDDVVLTEIGGGGQNLLLNPGFETGTNDLTADNWTTTTPADFANTSFWRGNWGSGSPNSDTYSFVISNQANGSIRSEEFIEATANTSYDLHAYVRGELDDVGSSGSLLLLLCFYNASEESINTPNCESVASRDPNNLDENWEEVGGTVTTPAGTAYVKVKLLLHQANGWVAFDDVTLLKNGTGSNLVTNPSFEDGTGWTTKISSAFPGTSFWRDTWGTSNGRTETGATAYVISNHAYGILQTDNLPVTANAEYNLYAWVRGEIDDDESFSQWYLRVVFYDSANNNIGYKDADLGYGDSINTIWQYRGGRVTAPAGAVTAKVFLINYLNSGWVAFDQVLFTKVSGYHWKFDEGSGATANDSSFNSYDGALQGPPQWTTGYYGQALDFDSDNNDSVQFDGTIDIVGGLTVSAWVRPEQPPTRIGRLVVSTYDWDSDSSKRRGWFLGDTYGAVDHFTFGVLDDNGNQTMLIYDDFFDQYLDQWVHVTGVYRPDEAMELYIDGQLVVSDTTDIPAQIGLSGKFRIGAR